MNPTMMAEKQMFPILDGSNSSDGEPDAVKVARPVRRGGWRRPAGAIRPLAALSLLYVRQEARRLRVPVWNPARSEPVAREAGSGARGGTGSEASPTTWRRSPCMAARC